MHVQGFIQQPATPPAIDPGEVCATCGRTIGPLEQPYVWAENIVCFGCHRDLSQTGTSAEPGSCDTATPAADPAERVIFAVPDATVTRSHVTLAGVTYPVADVRFARLGTIAPRRIYSVITSVAGLALALAGMNRHVERFDIVLLLLGAALFVIGAATMVVIRPRYRVLLTANGVEFAALTARNRTHVRRVLDAIAQAIIERGQLPSFPPGVVPQKAPLSPAPPAGAFRKN